MFCINCGSEIVKEARFCKNCGYNLGTAPLPTIETESAPAKADYSENYRGIRQGLLQIGVGGIGLLICFAFIKLCGGNDKGSSIQKSKDDGKTYYEKHGATCNICGKKFNHLGYTEVSHGNWIPCREPYQCFICSPNCGMKHTREWEDIERQLKKY